MVVVDVGTNGAAVVYFYGGVVGDIVFVFPSVSAGVYELAWDDVGADGVGVSGVVCGDDVGGADGSVVEKILHLPSYRAGEEANPRVEAPAGGGGECIGAGWIVLVWVYIEGIGALDCTDYWEYVLCNGDTVGVFGGVYIPGRCVPGVRGECNGGEFAAEELVCCGIPVVWGEAV